MHKRMNRSLGGNIFLFVILALFAVFFLLPIVYAISTALKPINEILIFPPRILVAKPTVNNFIKLSNMASSFWVPLSRYIFNSSFISVAGTIAHLIIASMAAYPMAKHKFYGYKVVNKVIVLSLLFTSSVTYLPQYIVLAKLHMIDTYLAIILPAVQATLGLYLMINFMKGIPDEMLEAAKVDGAKEIRVFWSIVMPNVKPAWLTMIIFAFQGLWNNSGGSMMYSEELKTLPAILTSITAGGVSRAGVAAAAALILMIPPILLFAFSQSKVIETMSTSGMK